MIMGMGGGRDEDRQEYRQDLIDEWPKSAAIRI
jgi:hypothetical protein